jgi:hypothetical protein
MEYLCKHLAFDDNGIYPKFIRDSDLILEFNLGNGSLRKRRNELYLQCRR